MKYSDPAVPSEVFGPRFWYRILFFLKGIDPKSGRDLDWRITALGYLGVALFLAISIGFAKILFSWVA